MTTNQTALFPDGYNGHKIECDLEPLVVWATTVKLRVTGATPREFWQLAQINPQSVTYATP